MTNFVRTEPDLAALTATEARLDITCDVWSSLLSLASACTPALAAHCIVELIQDGAELRRATVVDGRIDVESAPPLPTTRELMLSGAPSLVTADVVAVPVVSAPGSEPYVGVITCRGPETETTDVCGVLQALVRRVTSEIHRAQLMQALIAERERTANLQIALESNREIGMAMGIIIERLGCTPDGAFTTLRRVSQDANRKLREVAADIVLSGDIPGLVRGPSVRPAAPAEPRPDGREHAHGLLGAGHIADNRHPRGHVDARLVAPIASEPAGDREYR